MYKFLLFDLDDTILDFKSAETHAFSSLLEHHGIQATPQRIDRYSAINQALWLQLERKEVKLTDVLHGRFELFFREIGIQVDGEEEETLFRFHLNQHAQLIPDSRQLLAGWHSTYKVYAVSNGVLQTQMLRLKLAQIDHLFHGLFISETVGVNKPDPAFFRHVADSIPDFRADQAIIIGDSLSSDIRGGSRAGITTCWFNRFDLPNPTEPDLVPDHVIHNLSELDHILKS